MNMDIDSFCEIMDKILKDNDIAMLIKSQKERLKQKLKVTARCLVVLLIYTSY